MPPSSAKGRPLPGERPSETIATFIVPPGSDSAGVPALLGSWSTARLL